MFEKSELAKNISIQSNSVVLSSINSDLLDNVVELLKICLLHMGELATLATHNEYQSLKAESNHLDLLLKLLSAKISIRTYLDYFNTVFSYRHKSIIYPNYLPQLLFLEKNLECVVYLDDELFCFVKILQICNYNIKLFIGEYNYCAIKEEIYYNHNVPTLIKKINRDLIRYYLFVERPSFISNCPRKTIQNYFSIWRELFKQFSFDVVIDTQFIIPYYSSINSVSKVYAIDNSKKFTFRSKHNSKPIGNGIPSITDHIGKARIITYGLNKNIISILNGTGEIEMFAHDSKGKCISKTIITAFGNELLTENYTYDVNGRISQINYSDGSFTNIIYDSSNLITETVDSKARKTVYKYHYGKLIQIDYYDNTFETFKYDGFNRIIKARNRTGKKVIMTYDSVGNRLSKVYYNSDIESYSYDEEQHLISITNARGDSAYSKYDNDNGNSQGDLSDTLTKTP